MIITIAVHRPIGRLNNTSQNKNIIAIRITGKASGRRKIIAKVKQSKNSGVGNACGKGFCGTINHKMNNRLIKK
jgi:hypothetical protein